jgi:putative transposase
VRTVRRRGPACLPRTGNRRSARPAAKARQEIYNAEVRGHAARAVEAFARQNAAKFPKTVMKITDDEDELRAFHDLPAEHWIHSVAA